MRPSPDTPSRPTPGCIRPRLRSHTKLKSRPTSRLKRTSVGEDRPTAKPSKATKLPRTQSASRLADSPRDLALEPLYGLLSEVPQSMLFAFQVSPSSSQMYNGEDSSTVADPVLPDTERYASTGPEPMFDHTWRIAFVEARIPMEENRLPQVTSDQTICGDSTPPEQRCNIPRSGSLAPVSLQSGSVTPPVLRFIEPSDQDAAPVSLGHNVQLVHTYGHATHSSGITEYPSHFHPSTIVVHSSDLGDIDPQDGPPSPNNPNSDLLQQPTPVPLLWPPLYVPPFMYPPPPLPPILSSSLVSIPSELSSFAECAVGSIPYSQRKHSVLSFGEPHRERISQPPPPILRSETRDCDTLGSPYPDLRFPPPPPRTSFPTYQPLDPPGLPQGRWTSDYLSSHHAASGVGTRATHPTPFGMPGALFASPGHLLPYPVLQPAPSMTLPVIQPTPCTPTPWCTLFDTLKRRTQADPGTTKKKRRTSALTPERTAHEAGQPGLTDVQGTEQAQQLHPCPLCPRVFSLPNSLALHLKWHWGASGLEWKRGISRNGKGRERAKREAEEHRCRPLAAPVEQLPYGTETSVSAGLSAATSDVHCANGIPYTSPVENPNVASDSPFIPPVIPQASFEVFRMPCYSSSEASTSTSEVGESPGISPLDSGTPFPFPRLPSFEELALPQPLVGNAPGARPWDTEFVLQEGLSHTPPESAIGEDLQGAMSNHTIWSHNWFGCDNLDQGPDIAAEGGEDLDDLLGDPHNLSEVHGHRRVDGRHATQENVWPARPGFCVSDKLVASSVSHYRARSPASSISCSSPSNGRSASPGSSESTTSSNSIPVRAPRLAPSNLPPPLHGQAGGDDELEVHVAGGGSASDDVLLAALAPLSHLMALPPPPPPPPPELHAFGELSLLLS